MRFEIEKTRHIVRTCFIYDFPRSQAWLFQFFKSKSTNKVTQPLPLLTPHIFFLVFFPFFHLHFSTPNPPTPFFLFPLHIKPPFQPPPNTNSFFFLFHHRMDFFKTPPPLMLSLSLKVSQSDRARARERDRTLQGQYHMMVLSSY